MFLKNISCWTITAEAPLGLATSALPIGLPLCVFMSVASLELYLNAVGKKEVLSPLCT